MIKLFKDEIKKLRLELGLSQIEMAKKIGVGVSTWEFWEMGRSPRPTVLEPLIISKLKDMIKQQNKFRSGFMLLDEVSDKDISFNRKEAFILAKAAIIFQIKYYKNNPDEPFYNYDLDDLKERLKLININKFKEKNTLADIAEVIDNLKVVII